MRRTLIALGTATALTLGAVPAAHAQPANAVTAQIEELPADMRAGSSGAEKLSSASTEAEKQEGALLLGRDWLLGFAAITVLGTIIQAVMSAMR
ncbi:hypothetical protein B842_05970 [Corynebacterium humireducens NBRC 106098 = DSM 45392]|uniref:Secreted protein n=1 Tax=Corynebacterium humireducens NBRC 106098 = DSM 45392 TaxID=1223515 RepID=A0A0B5DA32_9CORY|nr:hypothetical protein [Corynebacterium humireducens]AJE33043.1 hypothetical protein B842_05970 [Corynebacterium humireducens NBRC 106098 = DSM 45392]